MTWNIRVTVRDMGRGDSGTKYSVLRTDTYSGSRHVKIADDKAWQTALRSPKISSSGHIT
jgi:hypothetical protein